MIVNDENKAVLIHPQGQASFHSFDTMRVNERKVKKQFAIEVIRLHWIKDDGIDDPEDKCIHGEVIVRIGDEVLSDVNAGSWSLGTFALFLLRSLTYDYEPGMYDNYLLPCCGHFIIPSDSIETPLIVQGCNIGIELTIKHKPEGVELRSETGASLILQKEEFQLEIDQMIRKIEEYYANSKPKTFFDNFEAQGWGQFWDEWEALKELNGIKTNTQQPK